MHRAQVSHGLLRNPKDLRQYGKKMKELRILLLLAIITTQISCDQRNQKLTGKDIELFENTPVWSLALAVDKQDTILIKNILNQNTKLAIDYQEPKLGFSLLIWSVFNSKYLSAEQLLKHGADPNLKSLNSGVPAITFAADNLDTSDFLRLCLRYGGQPNIVTASEMSYRIGTPLIAAAGTRLESVILLVEAGADINYVFYDRRNAILSALISEKPDILEYLLIEKKAEFYEPSKHGNHGPFVEWLREWVFPLDSKEYETKVKIVDYLKVRGFNYWETTIPKTVMEHYPETYWRQY